MRFAIWILPTASLWACAPQAAVPAQAPPTEQSAPASHWQQVEPAKQKQSLVPEPGGVPAADASCQQFVEPPSTGCSKPTSDLDALAQAMANNEPRERDRLLSCLESSPAFTPGLVRALRAEFAPDCADVLALPLLDPRRADLSRNLEDTLIALSASGRLHRLVQKAPELTAPFDRARFMDFFQSTLKPWIVAQAAAIHDLAAVGPRLSPYAKGVVAIEAGLADMRFVSVVRQVPLPKEMSDDAEVRDAYYAALDEALEPRKARGRDAALVGLREFANEGVVFDPRVERARALLSEVYSGRRIDALDKLLLPELPPAATDTSERTLASRLPSFYAGVLLEGATLDAPLLRALMERGLPKAFATRLAPDKLDEASKALLLRAVFDRGRVYFRAEDFASSARLSATEKPTPEQALYHALASSLQNGPRDGSDLLLRGPQLPSTTAQVAELDRLASQKSAVTGLAAFDAAYLLGLVPPQNDPKFWDALGKRFETAQRLLSDPTRKKNAREAANAAKDTAKALRANPAHEAKPTSAR
ncbi:MAG: hypothetical protein ABW061_19155 [Polyangiaceae bacterium]